eukprot:2447274-Pleurochrysis_carterae.AAC.2
MCGVRARGVCGLHRSSRRLRLHERTSHRRRQRAVLGRGRESEQVPHHGVESVHVEWLSAIGVVGAEHLRRRRRVCTQPKLHQRTMERVRVDPAAALAVHRDESVGNNLRHAHGLSSMHAAARGRCGRACYSIERDARATLEPHRVELERSFAFCHFGDAMRGGCEWGGCCAVLATICCRACWAATLAAAPRQPRPLRALGRVEFVQKSSAHPRARPPALASVLHDRCVRGTSVSHALPRDARVRPRVPSRRGVRAARAQSMRAWRQSRARKCRASVLAPAMMRGHPTGGEERVGASLPLGTILGCAVVNSSGSPCNCGCFEAAQLLCECVEAVYVETACAGGLPRVQQRFRGGGVRLEAKLSQGAEHLGAVNVAVTVLVERFKGPKHRL